MLQVYDRVLLSGNLATLIFVSLMALIAFIGFGYFELIRANALTKLGGWLYNRYAPLVFDGLLKRTRSQGYRGTQSLRDLTSIQQFFGGAAITAFLDAPFAPLFILLAFSLHWSIGLLTVFGGIILFSMAIAADLLSRRVANTVRDAELDAAIVADEYLRASDFVASAGMTTIAVESFVKSSSSRQSQLDQITTVTGSASSISKATRLILQSASLGLGAFLVISPNVSFTAGGMIAGSILMARALAPIEQSIHAWRSYRSAKQSLNSLIHLASETGRQPGKISLPAPSGRVSLENLTYQQDGSSEPLFASISASVRPGTLVCLVGPSGSGKTTLCRLLAGIDTPTRGTARIDDTDILNWNDDEIGSFVGYLPQSPTFFDGTIAQNVARLKPEFDHGEVYTACDEVGAHKLIAQHPDGYGTKIGTRGTKLSGGQSQFIGLARANFGQPVILVLDEPTAHLDTAGRKAFHGFLTSARANQRSMFIATHDSAIVQQADILIVLDPSGAKVQYNNRSKSKKTNSVHAIRVQSNSAEQN